MGYCMERQPPPLVAPKHTTHPSFSAALLDAINRSLDVNSSEIEKTTTKHANSKLKPDQPPQKKQSPSDFWWASMKRKQAPPSYTSSDSSSFGFSSDAEPPPTKPAKLNLEQLNPPALAPMTPPQEKKKKSNLFRKRWRELRKGRTCANSTSTGAAGKRGGSPLSKFLKAIFSSSRTQKKKKNKMGIVAPQQGAAIPVPSPEEMVDVDMEAEVVKRRVEEILRDLEKEEEEEDEVESDRSSDLFELENLTEMGSHELPVYCTTSLVANHPAVCST